MDANTPKPNRAERRKTAAEARKAKAHIAVQFEKLDFSNPEIGEAIVELMEEAHRVVTEFLGDLDEMLENDPVVIDHVTLLFAPDLTMIGEAIDIARVFAAAVHPVAKYFHACTLNALGGENTHQIAHRFTSARDQVEELLMSIVLVVKALDGGHGDEDSNKFMLVKNLHALFDAIGVPRKKA